MPVRFLARSSSLHHGKVDMMVGICKRGRDDLETLVERGRDDQLVTIRKMT